MVILRVLPTPYVSLPAWTTSSFQLTYLLLSQKLFYHLQISLMSNQKKKMAGSFNRLPLEVLITILGHARNLPTIYKFICASARANAAFNIDSPRILDAAIERSIPEFKHSARMIAILGSFTSSSDLSFKDFVDRYKKLPARILSTAPASYAFMKGTPGPRYLVLTAYRIEVLQDICFISLLQNIHEIVWSFEPGKEQQTCYYPIKQSKTGTQFQAAAWGAPSWVEKMRIVRAYWNLFVYWNIQAISAELAVVADDWALSTYRTAITSINPCIGPHYPLFPPSYAGKSRINVGHEIEEMKCVLAATRELFGIPLDSSSSFTPFTASQGPSDRYRLKRWAFSPIFKENPQWRTKQPKLVEAPEAKYFRRDKNSIGKMNYFIRERYWHYWFRRRLSDFPTDSSERDQLFLPDYLGLCIWDGLRFCFLGLKKVPKECLVRGGRSDVRKTTNKFFSSTDMEYRWRDVFLQELFYLPGGHIRSNSEKLRDSSRRGPWPEHS